MDVELPAAEQLRLGSPVVLPEYPNLQSALTDPEPDVSMVTLNATGDGRYLGPSSGIFFALYARTYAQLSASRDEGLSNKHHGANQPANSEVLAEGGRSVDPENANLFARAFRRWVIPLYPILSTNSIELILERCIALETIDSSIAGRSPSDTSDLAIFYLVMSLGAVHEQDRARQARNSHTDLTQGVTAMSLYARALRYINAGSQFLVPSVPSIQMLLLVSLYSMHDSVATTQWQLVGRAMRVSLW